MLQGYVGVLLEFINGWPWSSRWNLGKIQFSHNGERLVNLPPSDVFPPPIRYGFNKALLMETNG